jgi:nitroreductase/NAD-dependent dihydropyrimidine dehydrogenase PreA subunit
MESVVINYDICNKDGICSDVCPRKLIEFSEELPVPVSGIENLCLKCGQCLAVCPKGAISVNGEIPDACSVIDKKKWPGYEQLDHLMKSRRSIRIYKDEPVERNIVERILDTCRYAPTGSNSQTVKWIIISEKDRIRHLGQLAIDWMKFAIETRNEWAAILPLSNIVKGWEQGQDTIFRGAPMIVITHAPEVGSLPLENCVIAMTYFDLASASMGLGACWVGLFMIAAAQHPPVRQVLRIPADNKLFGTMVVGYSKYAYQRIPPRNQPHVDWL